MRKKPSPSQDVGIIHIIVRQLLCTSPPTFCLCNASRKDDSRVSAFPAWMKCNLSLLKYPYFHSSYIKVRTLRFSRASPACDGRVIRAQRHRASEFYLGYLLPMYSQSPYRCGKFKSVFKALWNLESDSRQPLIWHETRRQGKTSRRDRGRVKGAGRG